MEAFFVAFANFMWGMPLVILLVGGGAFFAVYSRGLPYRYFRHALQILSGRYDRVDDPGEIPHRQTLSTALSGTLGLGNIAGVALALTMGGPGAIFWMWVTALVGVATKFYTASLAVMYRGNDSLGQLQGGPMYVVREGLGRRWLPLAFLFAVAGLFGTLPVFQVNQLVQILRDVIAIPAGVATEDSHFAFDLIVGLIIAGLVMAVILGRVQRVGWVTSRLVPSMVLFYLAMTLVVLVRHVTEIPAAFALIIGDAFTGQAAAGGAIGTVILMGVRRGAFSNEAGIGTESLAHGAARTREPIREGLVGMLGPVVDTLIVCTCTALVILVTGTWHAEGGLGGVTLTALAFESAFPGFGAYLLTFVVLLLALSTVLSFWYYGSKCLGFLVGAEHQHYYVWIYTALVVVGAVVSLQTVVGLIDGMYAVMAIPTMVSGILLAPKVNRAARDYFDRLKAEQLQR
ncbi:sodium:alanine symporter family protein [Marinimicrobium sp. ABcell2]|uniref:alanine/glycine:cation symporter family protein n=1 Tax=Marinimicrobium sp. ABcell2 TaxID=3069751 RepID=UPI0027B6650B|nr:amino acid carrier protein [Marinimicrobium sp. ABcell2]MDQ2078388.1 amino acid carrier protein [Marinimicrobium sp. ABcell2]